ARAPRGSRADRGPRPRGARTPRVPGGGITPRRHRPPVDRVEPRPPLRPLHHRRRGLARPGRGRRPPVPGPAPEPAPPRVLGPPLEPGVFGHDGDRYLSSPRAAGGSARGADDLLSRIGRLS